MPRRQGGARSPTEGGRVSGSHEPRYGAESWGFAIAR